MLWTVIRTPVVLGFREKKKKDSTKFFFCARFLVACFVFLFSSCFQSLVSFSAGGRNAMFKVSGRVILGHAYF